MSFSLIGMNKDTGEKVNVDQAVRRAAMYIPGAPGTGKSGLMENLILQDVNQGLGVMVIDPHGTLINNIVKRCEKRLEDIIILEPTDYKFPFGINLYECADTSDRTEVQERTSAVTKIFNRLFDMTRNTPRMAQFVRNCSHVMIMNHLTMAEIPRLLMDESYRHKLLQNVTDPQVKLFFTSYDRMKPNDRAEHSESTTNKYDELLQPIVRSIVGQAKSTINMRRIMDERKILLLKLNAKSDDLLTLIGAMFLSEVLFAAYSRGDSGKKNLPQFNIYLDEFPKYATEDFSLIVSELRKYGIGATYANQSFQQYGMDETLLSTALQAATKVVFRISGKDADEIINEFQIPLPPPIVVGTRPVLTITQDTVGHLIRNGHNNPEHVEFVQAFIRPCVDMVQMISNKENIRITTYKPSAGRSLLGLAWAIGGGGNDMAPRYPLVPSPMNQLNSLLYEVQQKHDPLPWINPVILMGFSDCEGGYFNLVSNLTNQAWEGLGNDKYCNQWLDYIKKTEVRSAQQADEFDTLVFFMNSLRKLMRVLAAEPILTKSGQVEPVLGPARTYADVANEWKQKLANLPNFTALVKLTETEKNKDTFLTLQTLNPLEGLTKRETREMEERLPVRLQEIKERNLKDGYIRPVKDVEAEIEARWNDEPPTIREKLL